jgi:hypothetical protein
MKRTLVVLALVAISAAGCRAIGPQRSGCGDACADSCEPCHASRMRHAPRPTGYVQGPAAMVGRSGNLERDCPGGDGCMFNRYCGHNCGPGYHPGPYDCSPCSSPHWGCTGHRHPHGYVSGQECRLCGAQAPLPCDAYGNPYPCDACGGAYACGPQGPPPGPGYCGGVPGPGACNSGDQYYDFNPGPPSAQTAYPYYTLRGPRDFLLGNPPPLGPY